LRQVLVKAIVHQPPARACHVQCHGWFGLVGWLRSWFATMVGLLN
jgi:hypothetical protein